ncbi:hypothetical protein [Arenibaculum pallidiluteum]|uniref:hypothetical protein n=1 Tax=Arenibaculum pallidiluteum TaxID=2812559 RepID=UPI001A979923|nr:hypothetical protein [Arenibaculum pallidiluteum]
MQPSAPDNALAAGAALLAAADGADAAALRRRLGSDDPGLLDAFDRHLGHLRESDGGDVAVVQALGPAKGDAAAAAGVMEALLRAAGGPGAMAPGQVAAARRVCETLNLSPTRFGL